MSERRLFTEADLAKSLTNIGSRLERIIPAYLIGGYAMKFYGRKAETKDVDTTKSIPTFSSRYPPRALRKTF